MARVSLDYLKANRPQVDQAKMDATTEADIRRHMVEDGHEPDAEPVGYRAMPSPADIRARLGLTQVAFANALGVPAATLRNWEQGRKQPDPAARSLLTIFDREPEAAMRALGFETKPPSFHDVLAEMVRARSVETTVEDKVGIVVGQLEVLLGVPPAHHE
ncbi:helix-turn-helix domain-containing protein [Methylobacterium sp. Leaf106]|uniref:helix-turn-helix domain-containing protein n=1 Tax=Methylobacterium sp. Leaf106 TaxID=1736255 RepID=UPI0009E6972E|nr:helix-turn-helix domain-containing protein [Methylobacterium sp. Leaf106]